MLTDSDLDAETGCAGMQGNSPSLSKCDQGAMKPASNDDLTCSRHLHAAHPC